MTFRTVPTSSMPGFRSFSSMMSPLRMMGKEPFGSPTLSDQALMHFPSVKIGPGNSARSHAADEYIGLMEIREAIDMYIKLLDQLTIDH